MLAAEVTPFWLMKGFILESDYKNLSTAPPLKKHPKSQRPRVRNVTHPLVSFKGSSTEILLEKESRTILEQIDC